MIFLGIGVVAFVVIIGAIVAAGFRSAQLEASHADGHLKNADLKGLSADNEKILKISNQLILDERLLANRIKSADVRAALNPALDKAEDIVKVLKSDPSQIPSTKQFLNYYIPTLDVILKKYMRLENSNVDIDLETEKIISYLADINKAMDRQYKNLFNDDKLDLSVEMEAMTLAFQRDGLITESEYKSEEAAQEIELSLM